MRERKRLRLVADDALIYQVEFRIGALALDRSGVKYLIAWLEQRDIGPDGVDNAGRVVAQNFGLALGRAGALADLVVDGICGNSLHRDAEIAAARFGFGGLEIDQCIRGLDRQRFSVSDGFHALGLLVMA